MVEAYQDTHGLDIGKQQVGTIYAKALLGATETSGRTTAVLEEFQSLITDVLDRLPDFDRTLSPVRVAHGAKVRILDRAFGTRMSEELLTFLKVVSRHGRLDCLRAIFRAAHHLYNQSRGVLEVRLTSAAPVGHAARADITKGLRGSLRAEVEMDYRTDPELIGGMVVRVGDTVYDGSVVNQLQQLRARTLEKAFQKTLGGVDRFVDTNH